MYRLINKENANILEPIKTVFKNRNIDEKDIEWFIKPTSYEYSPKLLGNIETAVQILLNHIEKNHHIHIQIDKDLDGFTSSAILINYLKRVFPSINLTWSNHQFHKKHGIDIGSVPITTKLLIVPDAGSNEYTIHKELHEKDVEILVIDHHEAPHYSTNATVINNQLDNYPNKWLSGAGVVYKFIQLLDEKMKVNYAKDYVDLVAFGLIGDAMQLSSKETKWLITSGLTNVKNEFLKEIMKENLDAEAQITPTVISFKCIPKINAYLRIGTTEELDDLFKALLGHQEITINPRLRKADKSESWARRITRICNNMYARQYKLRAKLVEELGEKIEREKLNENTFMVVEIESELNLNMTGYIASFLVSKYRKPVILLKKNAFKENVLNGSLRGYEGLMRNTKDFLSSLELFDYAEGHQNAAGVQISYDNFKLLDAKINEAFQNLKIDNMYLVDLIMPANSLTEKTVKDLENYSYVWGKGIEAPLFAIEKLEVNLADAVVMGKSEDMLKFVKNGVSFMKFSNAEELIELKNLDKTVTLNVIGRTGLNTWKGVTETQFVIDAYEIVEIAEKKKFVF